MLSISRSFDASIFEHRKELGMAGPDDITSFSAVDRTKEPDFFKRFLDEGNKLPDIISSKPIILAGLQLNGGDKVLDAGCGLGDDTFEIARIVGSQGHVVGVDVSETMILEARRRAPAYDLNAEFEVGDAQALRFADATFDACRTERMLMHVPDAERAFAEMVRVIRRGGRLSVFDFDWEAQIVDSPYTQTTRQITRSFCDSFKNGWIGRRLPRLFRQHAMTDVSITPRTIILSYPFSELLLGGHVTRAQHAGALSPADVEQWWTHLREAHEAGTFFYGLTALIVAGTKS
jgi:ubiquinone/menaquinone biosynthesis C-methylase UbiE